MSNTARRHAERMARELTLAASAGLGVELTADQAIDLYCRFRDGIAAVLGELLEDLAACGGLRERPPAA